MSVDIWDQLRRVRKQINEVNSFTHDAPHMDELVQCVDWLEEVVEALVGEVERLRGGRFPNG